MPDFSPVITLAYERILGRLPDPGGLENYNRLMNSGLTEAQMREFASPKRGVRREESRPAGPSGPSR